MGKFLCVLLGGALLSAPAGAAVILQRSGLIAPGDYAEFELPVAITAPGGHYRFTFKGSVPLTFSVLNHWGYCTELVDSESGDSLDEYCEFENAPRILIEEVSALTTQLHFNGYSREVEPLGDGLHLVLTHWEQPGFIVLDNGAGAGSAYSVSVDSIPEPAAWALMLTGFGLVGMQFRRRAATA